MDASQPDTDEKPPYFAAHSRILCVPKTRRRLEELLIRLGIKRSELETIFLDYELDTILEKLQFLRWARQVKKRAVDDDDPETWDLVRWELETGEQPPLTERNKWLLWALENDIDTSIP